MTLFLRLYIAINKVPIDNIRHIDDYDTANWISLAVTPVVYLVSIYFIKNFEKFKTRIFTLQGFIITFGLFAMLSTMRSTFFVVDNPRNTLVMYFMGIVLTGVFFTFEYLETLFLAIVTGVCFAFLLPFYQSSINEIFMNNMASLVLLTVFVSISRYAFSYRADNFLKLKAIEEKNLEIENASVIKNEILGIVAHDLRNPLAAIKTLAMVMEDDSELNEDNRENVQMIKSACDKAASIINDLLETAHNEINEFDVETTEVNQFLRKVVDDWKMHTNKRVNILYFGTEEPVYSSINTEKMQRVLDNLISNAVKFSGDSNVEVSLQALNSQVIINVRDFGMGIPNDLLPFIFDRFSKASRKGIRGEESVGLGLSIVRQIIKKHGGEIEVDSVERHGTTFTIKLQAAA
ncbi:MAG: HAMP domain-containing sensor histidine kinase [Mucilaginibacter sp.]